MNPQFCVNLWKTYFFQLFVYSYSLQFLLAGFYSFLGMLYKQISTTWGA